MALIPNSPETRGVLTEMEEVASAERHSAPIRAVFGAAEVMRALTQRQYRCRCDLKVGGISIDHAVGLDEKWVGLDLTREGSTDGVLSLDELRLLGRAGFCVFPVGEREWRLAPDRCLQQIAALLRPKTNTCKMAF